MAGIFACWEILKLYEQIEITPDLVISSGHRSKDLQTFYRVATALRGQEGLKFLKRHGWRLLGKERKWEGLRKKKDYGKLIGMKLETGNLRGSVVMKFCVF